MSNLPPSSDKPAPAPTLEQLKQQAATLAPQALERARVTWGQPVQQAPDSPLAMLDTVVTREVGPYRDRITAPEAWLTEPLHPAVQTTINIRRQNRIREATRNSPVVLGTPTM